MGTVRSIEVDGKYVTIWYTSESQEVSLILAEKGETIFITRKDRVMN
jgi:capsid portal protein